MTSCNRGAEDDTIALDRDFYSLTWKCFPKLSPLLHEEEIYGKQHFLGTE